MHYERFGLKQRGGRRVKTEARKRKPPVCEKALTYASGKCTFYIGYT